MILKSKVQNFILLAGAGKTRPEEGRTWGPVRVRRRAPTTTRARDLASGPGWVQSAACVQEPVAPP